jgi:hypothetical protein
MCEGDRGRWQRERQPNKLPLGGWCYRGAGAVFVSESSFAGGACRDGQWGSARRPARAMSRSRLAEGEARCRPIGAGRTTGLRLKLTARARVPARGSLTGKAGDSCST